MTKFYTESGKTLQYYSPAEILEKGLGYASRVGQRNLAQSLEHAAHENRVAAFKRLYGPKPETTSRLWMDMQTTEVPEAHIDVDMDNGVCLDNLFTALLFVRTIPKCSELEIVLLKSSRSISRWVHFFIRRIQALKVEKITWPENLGYDSEELEIVTVSTFRCGVAKRHSDVNSALLHHSHAHNGPAYVYEIARTSDSSKDKVIWMKGPFPGGLSKTQIFNESGLCTKLEEEPVIGLADNGYIQEPILWTPGLPSTPDSYWKWELLVNHEMFFHEMRQYQILHQKYRHSEEMHKVFFEAIVVLCQMDLDEDI